MIYKIYNLLKEKDEDLAAGLAAGLAVGLAWGLAAGLAAGLAWGLAAGLAWGLAWGLAAGLAAGLANLSQLMPINLFSIIALITITLILAEILYGFNKKEKNIRMGKVIWLKIDAVFTSLLIIINCLNMIWAINHIKINFDIVLKWIGYIGAGLIALAVVGGIIYLWLLWNKKRLTK